MQVFLAFFFRTVVAFLTVFLRLALLAAAFFRFTLPLSLTLFFLSPLQPP
jgi:hypothetical protein